MRIFRGPSTKSVFDASHELVDEKSLSKLRPWTGRKFIEVNVTKDGIERKSVVNIELRASDVVALHDSLLRGLLEHAEAAEEVTSRLNLAIGALTEIRRLSNITSADSEREVIQQVRQIATEALKAA